MTGFFFLHRQIMESAIFSNANLLKFWIYCLCKASHQEHSQMVGLQEISLKKGQFIFGRKVASRELDMNENTVYKYLKTIEKMSMIETNSNNKFSVITVVNWEKYQGFLELSNNNVTTEEQQNNNNITSTQQQRNTNNNVNKGNKGNKKEKDTAGSNESAADILFERVWILIPSHKNDVKKNVKTARKKQLLIWGYDKIKKACEDYLSEQKPEFLHKRDNFFNNIIDNYIADDQSEQPTAPEEREDF